MDSRFDAKILVAVYLLEQLFNKGTNPTVPIHGIRDIRILNVEFDSKNGLIVFSIRSRDIPAYVAYHKIKGDLKYLGEYPLLEVRFKLVEERI